MRFTNRIKCLSLYGERPVLRVIHGNPLVVRGNLESSRQHLSLVWKQDRILAEKKPQVGNRSQVGVAQGGPPGPWCRRAWQWLNDNGNAIMVAVTFLTIGWTVFSAYSRLGQLEERISGKGGLEEKINGESGLAKINERLASIETTLKDIDKYVLQQLKPKAEVLLGTPDVEVFRVVRNEMATNASFSVPYRNPQAPQETFLTYTVEGIREGFLIVRAQIEEEAGGKVVRSLYDRRIQIRLPSEVGKRDSYCFKFSEGGSETEPNWIGPPVCIELALLERTGPDNLIFASAIKPEAAS